MKPIPRHHERGQGRIEFAVILLLVLAAVIVIVAVIGSHGNGAFTNIAATPAPYGVGQ